MLWGILCLLCAVVIWNFSRTAHLSRSVKIAIHSIAFFLAILGCLLLFGSLFDDPVNQARQLLHSGYLLFPFALLVLGLSLTADIWESAAKKFSKKHH